MSHIMRILKTLLITLLLFFPFGELIRFDVGNNIIVKPLDVIGGLIFFWTTVMYVKEKKFRSSLQWYFFLFPLTGLVSLGINSFWLKQNELLTSSLYLLRWVSYLSVFFAMLQMDEKFKKKVVWFLIADGLAVVLIGYLQYFFYPSLRNLFYQGWDDHLYRMFSSFLDPNFVGAFFVLYLVFIVGLLFNNLKNRKIMLMYSLVAALTLIAVFLTTSRSALLMLILSGISFFVFLNKKKFIIYLILLIFIFIIIASPFFYLENVNLFRSYSSFQRVSDTKRGFTIAKDHPIIGVGFNSYRYAQYRYHYESPINPNPVHDASGTDNSFLFVLATTGIVGLAAYCYMWFRLLKKAKTSKGYYPVVFIASAIGLFVDSFFNNSLFYPEIVVWMWLITSFIYEKK
jgi:O-antigen ligase